MRVNRSLILGALLVLLGAATMAATGGGTPAAAAVPMTEQPAAAGVPEITPVVISLVAQPVPVKMTDGKNWTFYELFVTNTTEWPLALERLVVTSPKVPDWTFLDLDRAAIAGFLRLPGGGLDVATLGPSQSCVIYVNVPFYHPAAVPDVIENTLLLTLHKPGGAKLQTAAGYTVYPAASVPEAAPLVLETPPMRGKRWIVAASGDLGYHRTALMGIDCQWRLAQRHAFDLVQLTRDERLVTGPSWLNTSYLVYGQEVLAVRDALVAAVHDGEEDNIPGHKPSHMTAAKASGNYVVLDFGDGRYALYAHLIPGSLRVSAGETVAEGQVLGLAGNSGNSDAPHLHFHIMDAPDPLNSSGLPCVFKKFNITGFATIRDDPEFMEMINNGGRVPVKHSVLKERRTGEMPQDMSVVDLP